MWKRDLYLPTLCVKNKYNWYDMSARTQRDEAGRILIHLNCSFSFSCENAECRRV